MKKSKGFTLIELLVVISIIAVLMAIMMPALGKVREQAKTLVCKTHLNQIGKASTMYTVDAGGRLVSAAYPSTTTYTPTWPGAKGWVMWFSREIDEVRARDANSGAQTGPVLGTGFGLGRYVEMEMTKNAALNNTDTPAKKNNPFSCPSLKKKTNAYVYSWPENIDYGMNLEFAEMKLGNIKNSQGKVLFADAAFHTIAHDRDFMGDAHSTGHNMKWYSTKLANGFPDGTGVPGTDSPVVPGRHNSKDADKGVVALLFVDGHVEQSKRMDMTRSIFDNGIQETKVRSEYDRHQIYGFED